MPAPAPASPPAPQVRRNAAIARQFLDDADREFDAGDLLQASEKLWGATSHALKALCRQRGWPHAKYAHRRDAARRLSELQDDPAIFANFKIAQSCHANFYNDWMYAEDVDTSRAYIRELVGKILQLTATEPEPPAAAANDRCPGMVT